MLLFHASLRMSDFSTFFLVLQNPCDACKYADTLSFGSAQYHHSNYVQIFLLYVYTLKSPGDINLGIFLLPLSSDTIQIPFLQS